VCVKNNGFYVIFYALLHSTHMHGANFTHVLHRAPFSYIYYLFCYADDASYSTRVAYEMKRCAVVLYCTVHTMEYLITIVLLALSALFSGLTLGLMGLDVHTLRRKARLGNKQAVRIVPVREKGNQLLTTLLLGNVLVNSVLAIFLGSIASGLVATLLATALIFILGEIIPQAVISRHAMVAGAYAAPVVHLLMRLSWPITYPIGAMLDKVLGEELPTIYTRRELMEIVSEHENSKDSSIDTDEERIVHGALQFSQQKVKDVMTPASEVVSFRESRVLDTDTRMVLTDEGFSRYPVFADEEDQIVGILYAKDVLVAGEKETVGSMCERKHLSVRPEDNLDKVLAHMLKRRLHMAIVKDELNTFLGVITLEDIIEEVIQQEILDEDDDVGEV
jgi:metal transporter CNNM